MPFSPACTTAVPTAVLDSNVWIDLLLFDDPAVRPIGAALADGRLIALTDARCAAELTRVLDYPNFARFVAQRDAAPARLAQLVRMVELSLPAGARPLPVCRDPDDQKFLELADAARAAWLVTKDRDLLKLARKAARDHGFRIGTPAACVAALALETGAAADRARASI